MGLQSWERQAQGTAGQGTGGVEISTLSPGSAALTLLSAPGTLAAGGHSLRGQLGQAFQEERPRRQAGPPHLPSGGSPAGQAPYVPRARDLFSHVSF